MLRRFILVGLASALVAPIFAIAPASALILFSCSSDSVTLEYSPGLGHDATAQTAFLSASLDGCDNGQSGTITPGTLINSMDSFPDRPLGCPEELGGAVGNNYPDQTPLLLGGDPSFRIDWATGDDSLGIAKVKASGLPLHVKIVLNITAGQYAPLAPDKTKLKGSLEFTSASDSFSCADNSDPMALVNYTNDGDLFVNQKSTGP